MKIRILPSSPDISHLQHLISFVIDDRLAIDAGCLGLFSTADAQSRITSVVLTHAHLDHIASLPMYAMNVMDACGRGVDVWAPFEVIASLRLDVFNGRTWPDFTRTEVNGRPIVNLKPIEPRQPTVLDGYTITAIPLNHPVPTVGYLVDDGRSTVVFALDTGPTTEIWKAAKQAPRLTAVFVDVAFPEKMTSLAEASGHLTPSLVRVEVAGLPAGVRKIASHIKPAFHDRIVAEVKKLGVPDLVVGRPGHVYEC